MLEHLLQGTACKHVVTVWSVQQPSYGGHGTNQALQPSAGAGAQQGYNYVAPAQQSFGQQLQGQQQTGYNQTQAAGYSAYGSQQGMAAKPSAAVQAVQGLAPDQQAKLTQIMAQVVSQSVTSSASCLPFIRRLLNFDVSAAGAG